MDAEGGEVMAKYFNGPSGVYYDPVVDEIYTLQRAGVELFNLKTQKMDGWMYNVRGAHVEYDEIAIRMDKREWIWVGEL